MSQIRVANMPETSGMGDLCATLLVSRLLAGSFWHREGGHGGCSGSASDI